jgi:hypothetical protein
MHTEREQKEEDVDAGGGMGARGRRAGSDGAAGSAICGSSIRTSTHISQRAGRVAFWWKTISVAATSPGSPR